MVSHNFEIGSLSRFCRYLRIHTTMVLHPIGVMSFEPTNQLSICLGEVRFLNKELSSSWLSVIILLLSILYIVSVLWCKALPLKSTYSHFVVNLSLFKSIGGTSTSPNISKSVITKKSGRKEVFFIYEHMQIRID